MFWYYAFSFWPKNNYSKAEELFADAKYSEAYEIYDMLGNYEDSDDKAKECLYIQATALRNEKKWDEANAIFEQIKDYKDSVDLIHLCNFVEVASKDPTCDDAGYKDFKCEACGATTHSDYDAKGHNYSDATCSAPKKCRTCGKTSGNALGHTSGGTKCSRCGTVTFKTKKYSGSGPSNITNIDLPAGKYNITFTHSGNSNFIVHGSVSEIWVNEIGKLSYVCQVDCSLRGISDGYINITNADGYWTITIEALD